MSLQGQSMVNYIEKVAKKKIKLKMKQFFTKIQESIFKFYLNFIFETIEPSIRFIVNQYKISKTLEW
jgi:hypothetical protein